MPPAAAIPTLPLHPRAHAGLKPQALTSAMALPAPLKPQRNVISEELSDRYTPVSAGRPSDAPDKPWVGGDSVSSSDATDLPSPMASPHRDGRISGGGWCNDMGWENVSVVCDGEGRARDVLRLRERPEERFLGDTGRGCYAVVQVEVRLLVGNMSQ